MENMNVYLLALQKLVLSIGASEDVIDPSPDNDCEIIYDSADVNPSSVEMSFPQLVAQLPPTPPESREVMPLRQPVYEDVTPPGSPIRAVPNIDFLQLVAQLPPSPPNYREAMPFHQPAHEDVSPPRSPIRAVPNLDVAETPRYAIHEMFPDSSIKEALNIIRIENHKRKYAQLLKDLQEEFSTIGEGLIENLIGFREELNNPAKKSKK